MTFLRITSAIVLALGLATAGYFINRGIVKFKRLDHFVEVKGLSERLVKSNESAWTINYTAHADDLSVLNKKVMETQQKIKSFLVAKGFAEDEIEKSPTQINDADANQYSNKKGPRFVASGHFAVSTKQVDAVTRSVSETDELIKAGVVIGSTRVEYYFTDLNQVKPEMLKEATANAKEAAKSFAEDSGSRVGKIKDAYQGQFSIQSPHSDYDARSTVMKKIRVVTTIRYFLD